MNRSFSSLIAQLRASVSPAAHVWGLTSFPSYWLPMQSCFWPVSWHCWCWVSSLIVIKRMWRIFRWIRAAEALDTLHQHWRIPRYSATDPEKAQQALLDSELQDGGDGQSPVVHHSGARATTARSAEWAVHS